MPRARANGVELEYDTFGDPADPPLLLVMGLGAQLIDWPPEFAAQLAAHGFHVIRFDNRDAGLSTWLDEVGMPDLPALLTGTGTAPYSLADMGDDAVGLLDALGIQRAHIVGASMGGMIVQRMVLDHPDRVLSMTSIMSTTGARDVGQPSESATAMLLRPQAPDRESAIEAMVAGYRLTSSTGFVVTDEELRDRAVSYYDRAYHPAGGARQLAAIIATPDRTEALAGVTVPTSVIHGDIDRLVNVSGGRATAAAIPGAELLIIPGMGHDLPTGAWPQLVDTIVRTAKRAG
ncbi:MAG TPA: alpha/beta fold hydrolase [Pseudonocardiaceae bacterium]|nr:alpha/beta fold hydrolase [Pseudonocardiaceae bacterium]